MKRLVCASMVACLALAGCQGDKAKSPEKVQTGDTVSSDNKDKSPGKVQTGDIVTGDSDERYYKTSHAVVADKAAKGDAEAMCELGRRYRNGIGVKMDEKLGVEWYRKAIDKGCDLAMFNLGWCYQNGEGVDRDEKKAIEWFEKAAKSNLSENYKTTALEHIEYLKTRAK